MSATPAKQTIYIVTTRGMSWRNFATLAAAEAFIASVDNQRRQHLAIRTVTFGGAR